MNIGICLTGISYSNHGRLRDFRKTYQNFNDMIFNPLSKNNNVTTYVTTYPHEHTEELISTYKPKKHYYVPLGNSYSRVTYMHGLCLVEDEDLDVIVSTRFDISFKEKITDMNIDYSKFNFLFKEKNMWDSYRFITDNFFVFPKNFLYPFTEAIEIANIESNKEKWTFMLHNVYNPLANIIGENNIHIIHPEVQQFSHDNTYYKLERTEV